MKSYSAIVLSAGYSSRMGSFKPLMDLGGRTPLQSCLDLFNNCGINDIIVVTGYRKEYIERELKGKVKTVFNTKYNEGMFSSIKAGVGMLSKATDGFFLLPVDIPSIKTHTIKKMMESFENIGGGILFPSFNEKKGHPPLISYSLAEEILQSNPKGGLKDIFNHHKNLWQYEKVEDRGILIDMDKQVDYELLLEYLLEEQR
ncbi:MAG TPA: nucleotidyltransferase family protein [Clostridiaceae bacterium]